MTENISAEEALKKLIRGNEIYVDSLTNPGDISMSRRVATFNDGQKPYAIILACSDSREIPEAIFSAGIGDLFVIRVAGNVVDDHQLGSIEYAAEHLGCRLVLVLGHNCCGAVDAAMNHDPDNHIKYITDKIAKAIGKERNEFLACCLNVRSCVKEIENDIDIHQMEDHDGLKVLGAIYHLENGKVDFLDSSIK